MAAGSESLSGPRLEFVLKKIPGTVVRQKYTAPPTKRQIEKNPDLEVNLSNTVTDVTEAAGYMVYFPTGQCYRIATMEEVVAKKFDREPNILSFDQARSTDTAAGRFRLARTDTMREKAWKEMEQEVIRLCLRGSGDLSAYIANYDPKGQVPKEAA